MQKSVVLLDENEREQLFSVNTFYDTISVLVSDGLEYFPKDWQGSQPQTLDECSEYDWVCGEDYALT